MGSALSSLLSLASTTLLTRIQVDRTAGGHRPPDTVIGVASLAKSDILYECEVWAIVN